MAKTRCSLVNKAHASSPQPLVELRRKPLRSPQPSEEPFLFSPLNQPYNQGKATSVDEQSSIPLRRLLSSPIDTPERSGSATPPERVQEQSPWRPGFWIRFPVLGITALILTVFCKCTLNGQSVSSNISQAQPQQLWSLLIKSYLAGNCHLVFYYLFFLPYQTYFSLLLLQKDWPSHFGGPPCKAAR
jgi:hypothetical protein